VGARRRLNYLPNPSSRGVSGRAAGRGAPPAGAVAFLCNSGDRLPPGRGLSVFTMCMRILSTCAGSVRLPDHGSMMTAMIFMGL